MFCDCDLGAVEPQHKLLIEASPRTLELIERVITPRIRYASAGFCVSRVETIRAVEELWYRCMKDGKRRCNIPEIADIYNQVRDSNATAVCFQVSRGDPRPDFTAAHELVHAYFHENPKWLLHVNKELRERMPPAWIYNFRLLAKQLCNRGVYYHDKYCKEEVWVRILLAIDYKHRGRDLYQAFMADEVLPQHIDAELFELVVTELRRVYRTSSRFVEAVNQHIQ
jgi:hypothetical protein